MPQTGPRAGGFIRFRGDEPREGIFVLTQRALTERELEPWQRDALGAHVAWFARHMPVCRPPLASAVVFLRDREREMARRLWELARLLREVGVPVEMITTRRPGRVVREDDIQVAAIPPSRG